MAVPTAISELSTTPGSNPPAGSDAPSVLDDHARTAYAFIKTLSDEKAAIVDAVLLTGNQTVAGVKTFSSNIVANLTGNASGTAANVTGVVARANGGTGANYADNAALFNGIKQAASTTASGVSELSTDAEAQGGSGSTVVTAGNLNAVVPGMGQTLNAVTGARAFNTDYVNGARVRFVNITATTAAGSATGNTIGIQIDGGQQVIGSGAGGVNAGWPLSTFAMIPPGATYRANCANATLGQWLEYQ